MRVVIVHEAKVVAYMEVLEKSSYERAEDIEFLATIENHRYFKITIGRK